MSKISLFFLILALYCAILGFQSWATTDVLDVQALQGLYQSLNRPMQLEHWQAEGGDPCEEPWTGVQCNGSSIINLKLHGLGLTGNLGFELSNLKSLKHLDLSSNDIEGSIPYSLPPNLTHLILADNQLSGTLPYSIGKMKHLHHVNLSHNLLSGTLGDVFEGLENLKEMDLSFNYFTGSLPTSFRSLTNLTDLIGGNIFVTETNNGPRDKDIVRTSASNTITIESHPYQAIHGRKKLAFQIVIIILAISLAAAVSIPFIISREQRRDKKRRRSPANPNDPVSPDESVRCLSPNANLSLTSVSKDSSPGALSLSSPPRRTVPTDPRVYTPTELQIATNNFAKENCIREGPLGSLYRAVFANGTVVAVKNIKNPPFIIGNQQCLKAIKTIFNLKHPNIMSLLGYSIDQDQDQLLLVYEFMQNLSLDEALHSVALKPLSSYFTRLQIALGVARALEYMHLSCVPPIFYGNLKASNILLDEELQPLLCDCGLAIFNNAQMPGNAESDVYNFGELFLELLTGKKPFDSSRQQEEQCLVTWASSFLHDSMSFEHKLDPAITRLIPSSWLSHVVDIVSLCVQPEQELRPSMFKIAEYLTHLVQRQTAEFTGVTEFSYNQIVTATENFNSECLIEDSRWWKVYKGTFEEGKVYAVKQLENPLLKRKDNEIVEEVLKLQSWSHPNLVSIRGFCLHGECRFIVSDLPPSTSLASLLYNAPPKSRRLGWNARMFIALQVARGMKHLHDEGSFVKDLSAITVFVGDDLKTMILDVWIPRVLYMPAAKDCLSPSEMYREEADPYYSIEGYLPPVYIYPWSAEKDVYSFGILLLVLVSGKSAVDYDSKTFDDLLIARVRPCIKVGNFAEAVDLELGHTDPPMTEALNLVLRCTSSEEDRRPFMAEVVEILEHLYKETIDDFSSSSNSN